MNKFNWRIYFTTGTDLIDPVSKTVIGKRCIGMVEAESKEEAELRASKGQWRQKFFEAVEYPKEPIYRAHV